MMTVRTDDETAAEARSPSVAVGISVTVTIGIGRGVTDINPSLGHLTVHHPFHFLVGRTPGEPDRILRHAGSDLALSDDLLLARRQAGIEVAMLVNARFGGGPSDKEKRAGRGNGRQRPGENSTPNHKKKSYGDAMDESIMPIP